MGKLFGTDGVRGVANSELTPELAFKLGRFGAYVLVKQKLDELGIRSSLNDGVAVTGEPLARPRIIIGKDTRLSCQMLEAALAAGFCSAGADVDLAGVIPTPAVAWLVPADDYDCGVMISASHNASQFNGIKFFNYQGYKLPDHIEEEIESFILGDEPDNFDRPVGQGVGTIQTLDEAAHRYIEHLKLAMGIDLSSLRVVLDTAHGAATAFAPELFRELGADVVEILGGEPDGLNINDRCGSTHMHGISEAVVKHQADLGLAFDGDADRLLAVDHEGTVIDGDQILSILARWMKQKGQLVDDTLVVTVMSNLGLKHFCEDHEIKMLQTAVGDRYVLEKMRECDYNLGGEQSGHMILLDHGTTGDGELSALALCRALKEMGETLKDAASKMKVYPQVMVPAPLDNRIKYQILDDPFLSSEISLIESDLADGRILVRPSGTEPMIRVMVEGPDESEIAAIANKIRDLILEQAKKMNVNKI